MSGPETTGGFHPETLIGDEELYQRYTAAGQGHIFRFLDQLDMRSRARLLTDARRIDLDLVADLAAGQLLAPAGGDFEPLGETAVRPGADPAREREARERGEALLADGKVACITVAGGQGTRLGYPGPKGTFPIGPRGRTLFDIHGHRIAELSRRYGRPIPWVIMVSDATKAATLSWFHHRGVPGLDRAALRFCRQSSLPALDDDGRLLLATKDAIATAPDGHGGIFRALRLSGALAWLVNVGVTELSYFQVDNPLVPPVDPLFLGLHAGAGAQMSTKVFPKAEPDEKVGVVVRREGKPVVVEYTELPADRAAERDADGHLVYGDANMAAHAINVPFAAAVAFRGLPYHRVRKKVPHADVEGRHVDPAAPNAWKYETFVFDALELAKNGVVLEVDRSREFAPVKNATGRDSPRTARELMMAAGEWPAAGASRG